MRVVIFADYAIAEGGAPQVAIASARALADAGQVVIYVNAVGETADQALEGHPNIRRIALGGQDVWSKSGLAAARDGIWNREHARRLAALLTSFDPADTVVHVHQWTKALSPSLFAMIHAAGLPLVISLHDYFLRCPTGLKYRFDRAEPCQLRPMSAACLVAPCDPRSSVHKAVRVLRTAAVTRALKARSFTAIHVSKQSVRTISAELPANARQIVLPNPIDPGPRQSRTGIGRMAIYCGRLTPEKGVLLVAAAARRAGLRSLFVGEGPARDQILALDPDATITGWLDKDEVRRRIAGDARVLVAPSTWPETGPMVVEEALAAGVPVIVSDRAGAADAVVEGVTGLVVPPTLEAIAEALELLKDDARAATMGAEAAERFWRDPPSAARHAERLVDLYLEILAANRPQASGKIA